jgi:hypothetical protein
MTEVSKQTAMPDVSDIFASSDTEAGLTGRIDSMAQFAAVEEDAIGKLEDQITERKANLDKIKEDMATMMIQAGISSIKLECGLNPKAETKTKFFKAAGVDDDTLFDWLRGNQLGDIIKLHVAWQTLNSTLKTFRDQGNEVPAIINATEYKTVRMNGKSKFLASRNN